MESERAEMKKERAEMEAKKCEYQEAKLKLQEDKLNFFETREQHQTQLYAQLEKAAAREKEAQKTIDWHKKQRELDVAADRKRHSQLQAANDNLRATLHKWGKRKNNAGWVPVCFECRKEL